MKQTSYNIHFYIGIEVTSFDFQQFYPIGPNSPSPIAHPNLPSTHLLSNGFPENFHFPKMSSNVKDYPPPAPLAEQLLTQ